MLPKYALKLMAALVISVPLLMSETVRAPYPIKAIRHRSSDDLTLVTMEMSGDFHFQSARLHNTERIYFDILSAQPGIGTSSLYSEDLPDKRVERIRVARFKPAVTRVVLDLVSADIKATTTRLYNPNRLVIELTSAADLPARAAALPPSLAPPAAPNHSFDPAGRPAAPAPNPSPLSALPQGNDQASAAPPSQAAAPAPNPPLLSALPQGNDQTSAAPPSQAAAAGIPPASRDYRLEANFLEADLVGDVAWYRSVHSGFGTHLVSGGSIGIRLVENPFQHWGFEQSFTYASNNLRLLSTAIPGRATQGFGVRGYSATFNPIFYFTGLHSRFRPFLTAGAGAILFRPTDLARQQAQLTPSPFGTPVTLNSQTKLQFNFGGGLRARFTNNFGFVVEARGLVSRNPSFGLNCGCIIPGSDWLRGLELIAGFTFHWGHGPPLLPIVVPPPPHRLYLGTISGAARVCANSAVTLSSDAADPESHTLVFHWTVDGRPVGDNSRQFTFTPDRPGEYRIQLEIVDTAATPAPSQNALSFTVHAVDCAPPPPPPCNCPLAISCGLVTGDLVLGGTAPLHVTAAGPAVDKIRYNWSVTEGRIVNPNSADATFDSSGISFPPAYQTQTKIITASVTVSTEQGAKESCRTQITVRKDPEPVHYDVVFAKGRSRVNNCAKRFLIERLSPELVGSYRGYTIYLVGHRGANEVPGAKAAAALDPERVLNVAAVLTSGKASCGKLDRLRVKVDWIGAADTPYVETPCAVSTQPPVAERQADRIDYSDPQIKDRRVEIWLVPEGQAAPPSVQHAQVLAERDITPLGCPK
ncbi:MAG: AMIN domain-containing protein [Bryobacteraceae bacterium]|jgi:hypothetical protein